jgi:hypothetical protein
VGNLTAKGSIVLSANVVKWKMVRVHGIWQNTSEVGMSKQA